MFSDYSEPNYLLMQYEERLREAEQHRLARRLEKANAKHTQLGKFLAHVASVAALIVGLRVH